MNALTPRQIVQELDKHIVGQDAAKRAVAIALRNRWRRMQVGEPLRQEITPKNILMIGPTGVGKTEIARRLAKLVGAPFVKVEATKYTEVGYYGRDVESLVRDLVEAAITLVRVKERERVAEQAQTRAKQRLPDHPEISDTLGWIYLKKNLTDSALDTFRRLVSQSPDNATYHYHYAIALSKKGDRDTARRECQAALSDKPTGKQEEEIRQFMQKLT